MSKKPKAADGRHKLSHYGKRTLFYAAAVVLFLIVTNHAILWFLPDSTRMTLMQIWQGLFGNVEQVASAIEINWVSLFKVIAIILTTCLITNLARLIASHLRPKTGKGQSVISLVLSFVNYGAVFIGIIWCLTALGLNLSTVFASVGIIALIVGFAAESLIADIITGIFLVFENEFNVGDIVELNGFRGTITNIGVRVTYIEDAGGNIKVINNSAIKDILNKSRVPSRAVCDMPIAYSESVERAEEVLDKLLDALPAKYPDVFPKKPVYLGVQSLDASAVVLRVVAEVSEADVFRAGRLMNRELKIGFDAAGIEIPFQQVVVHQAKDL